MSDFLKTASILIVSSKPAHKTGVKKLLNDIGADYQKIEVAADFQQAKLRLESEEKIHILITDDDIGDNASAIDLISLLESNNQQAHSRLIIMTAGDIDEGYKENFLGLGGDLIIKKPFTTATFVDPFNEVLNKKCGLSHDEKMALDIEDALSSNNIELAKKIVSSMKDKKSSLANYSKGIISLHDKDYEKAFKFFLNSLEKKLNVKSLNGLVTSGVQSNKYSELGKYVEKWIKKFPLESNAVPDITRVVLYNKKFDLLDLMAIEDPKAKLAIAAGLVISSSVILSSGDQKKSIDYALKGIEFSGDKERVLLKAMEVLILAGAKEEAQKIISNNALKEKLEEYQDEFDEVMDLIKKAS